MDCQNVVDKLKIGNNIAIDFSIWRNGVTEDLSTATDMTVTVVLDPRANTFIPVSNVEVNDNVVSFVVKGSDQRITGVYRAKIKYRKPEQSLNPPYSSYAVDAIAFELVAHSCEQATAQPSQADYSVGLSGTIMRNADGVDGLDGHSPYIGENGNWFDFNDETQEFEDTGIAAQGDQGDTGETGKSAYQAAAEAGYPQSEQQFNETLSEIDILNTALKIVNRYSDPSTPRTTDTMITDMVKSVNDMQVAINTKGVPVDNFVPLSDYDDKILDIEKSTYKDWRTRFILPLPLDDADEYVIRTDYGDNGESILEYPVHPNFEDKWGIRFSRWTHTLEELQNIDRDTDVGAIYTPIDGKVHVGIFPDLDSTTTIKFYLQVLGTVGANVNKITIDFGDGSPVQEVAEGTTHIISHTYPAILPVGEVYVAKLWKSAGTYGWNFGYNDGIISIMGDCHNDNGIENPQRYVCRYVFVGDPLFAERTASLSYQRKLSYYVCGEHTYNRGLNFLKYCILLRCAIPPKSTTKNCHQGWTLECGCLKHIVLHDYQVINAVAFNGCYQLKDIVVDKKFTNFLSSNNISRTSITRLDFPETFTAFGTIRSLSYNYDLREVICRSVVPPILPFDTFLGIEQYLTYYVPDVAIDAYKSASNWVLFADQIKLLSQLPKRWKLN